MNTAYVAESVNALPIILFAVTTDGLFQYSLGSGLSKLGLKPGEVDGKDIFKVYAHEPEATHGVKLVMSGKSFTHLSEHGGVVFETTYTPVKDAGGKVSGVCGISIDVTERERATAELESINRSMTGRELKMIELKATIADLQKKLEKAEKRNGR